MDLSYSPEDLAFRDEVRAFLDAKLSPEMAGRVRSGQSLGKPAHDEWHAILNEQGSVSELREAALEDELAAAGLMELESAGIRGTVMRAIQRAVRRARQGPYGETRNAGNFPAEGMTRPPPGGIEEDGA